jgi:hypothetical protein
MLSPSTSVHVGRNVHSQLDRSSHEAPSKGPSQDDVRYEARHEGHLVPHRSLLLVGLQADG